MVKYTLTADEKGGYIFTPQVENFGENAMPHVGQSNVANMAVSTSGLTAPAMPSVTSTSPVAGTTMQPNITINMPDRQEPVTQPVGTPSQGAPMTPPASNEYQSKYEALLNTQVASVANELKNMGIADPDAIGKDMTAEQRLNVLKAIKDNYIKAQPGMRQPDINMGAASGNPNATPSREEQIIGIMKQNGIDPKTYMKYFTGDNA